MATALIGSDGKSPVYDPEGLWRIWDIDQVWLGPDSPALGRYIPKLRDYVVDPETYEMWIVTALDAVSLKPTLKVIRPAGMNYSLQEDDVLFGVGPGTDAETYRAYLNDSVFPYTLEIDKRCHIYGTLTSYAKIFLGADTTAETGVVISKMYDASGNFLSDNIPLQLASLDSHTNYSTKYVPRCYLSRKLVNGEKITAVFYSDDGHVVSKRQLLIENSDIMADANDGVKYITDISLKSIWLSATDADQLDYPLNIPMDALNLTGVVHYSDGSTLELPVNGTKFAMLGLEGRLASIPNQPHDLVLRYTLGKTEASMVSGGVNGNYIVKPYKIVTKNPNHSIAVKLFGFPFWDSPTTGYRMRWWMMNMARNVFFEVTAHVKFSEQTGPYDPLLYGHLQRKAITLNLRDVSGAFIAFNHTQVVDIVLNGEPTNDTTSSWLIGTEASDSYPRFGEQVYGKRLSDALVNFAAGHETFENWLSAYYRRARPLVNPETEVDAPSPTHFFITYKEVTTEWSIDQWNQDLNIGTVTDKSTATFRFVKRTASGDLQLGYAAAMIKSL